MATIEILGSLVVFMLEVEIWGGVKKLRPEDLAQNGIDTSKLPPSALATLGQKRIIDQKDLQIFRNLKKSAERLLEKSGSRFLKGFAVPLDKVDEINDELLLIKKEFETAKDKFIDEYEEKVEDWINSNPLEWAPVIRAAVESPTRVSEALCFAFAPLTITSPSQLDKESGENVNPALEEQVSGLFGTLCKEIRVAAKDSYEQSFVGRNSVNRKALRPLVAIREKMAGLAFLDPSIGETIDVINQTLGQLGKASPIEGTNLDMLAGLLNRRLSNFGRTTPLELEPELEPEETEEDVAAFNVAMSPPLAAPQSHLAPISWDF